MRILSIRGEGLRSLADPFEVDLAAGALRRGGLFAIVGPTGAGKSTLLDALCLALYGKVPRAPGTGGVRIVAGPDELSETDPRTCLSHGVGEGRAEVEFAVGEGIYRASWKVHRARKRADGKLQNDRMELTDVVADVCLADKKSDVVARVKEITGLDFDQFQRSVLLAQGQFARFLQADERERADLLETITGQTIYADLSMAAYRRAQELKQDREVLERQRAALELPTPEEVAEVAEALAAATLAKQETLAELRAVDGSLRWYAELDEHRGKLEDAAEEERVARAAVEAFAAEDAVLEKAARARELRAEFEAHARAQQRVEETAIEATEARKALEKATQGMADAGEKETAAVGALAALREERKGQEAEVEQARELDGRLKAAEARVAEAGEVLDRAEGARKDAETKLRVAEAVRATAGTRVEALELWLQENAALDAVAARADGVLDRLGTLDSLAAERTVLEKEQVALDGTVRELQQTVSDHQESLRSATVALCRKVGLAEVDPLPSASALAEAIRARRLAARDAVEEAEAALRRGQLQAPARELRESLAPGQACPVCGSTDHPSAHEPVPAPHLDGLRQALDDARAAVVAADGLVDERAALDESAVGLEREKVSLGGAEEKAAGCREKAGAAAGRQEELRLQLEPTLGPWRSTWEQERPASLLRELEGLLPQLADRRDSLARAREQLAGSAPELAAAQAGLDAAERTRSDAAEGAERAGAVAAELAVERKKLLGGRSVAAVVADWESRETRAAELADAAKNAAASARNGVAVAENALGLARRACETAETGRDTARKALDLALERAGLPEADVQALLGRGEAWFAGVREQRTRLHEAVAAATRAVSIRTEELAKHEITNRPEGEREALAASRATVEERLAALEEEVKRLFARKQGMEDRQSRAQQLLEELRGREAAAAPWEKLNDLIGSADGAKFRKFAQGLALLSLLRLANRQMARLKPRYGIERVPGTDLEIAIVDRDQADQARPVSSLSGGESFLVSLALALGLAQLTGGGSPIQSLFIDEGFGALDQDSLADALETLELLQSEGRTIGLISHVDALRERVVHQVHVKPTGAGRSVLEITF